MTPDRPKIGPHWRIPWRSSEPNAIHVHCRFDQVKGTYRVNKKAAARGEELYLRAKREFDESAADELVAGLIDPKVIDALIDAVLAANKPARVVFPHPEFDADEAPTRPFTLTNAIPFALGAFIASELDCDIETEIVECARPGRTKLNRFQRFLWQPLFSGDVSDEFAYILVDDNCTLGGTLAMLRTHIVGNGGTVAAVTALSKSDGNSCRFGIADETVSVLSSTYTSQISPLWIERIGHDITSLTESEGCFLVEWAGKPENRRAGILQHLRDRLDKAEAKGR